MIIICLILINNTFTMGNCFSFLKQETRDEQKPLLSVSSNSGDDVSDADNLFAVFETYFRENIDKIKQDNKDKKQNKKNKDKASISRRRHSF